MWNRRGNKYMKHRGHCTKLPQTSSCKANTGQGGAQSNGNRHLYAVHMHTDWPIAREKKVLHGIHFEFLFSGTSSQAGRITRKRSSSFPSIAGKLVLDSVCHL